MENFLSKLRDPYEHKARIFPGLLVIIPLVIPLVGVYGSRNLFLTSLVGIFFSCGAVYALSSIARGLGKKLEEKLVKKWGGLPTTIMLRHQDDFLDHVSKQRTHSLIKHKLGIDMPTPEQERGNPAWADGVYKGAARRIRELTRNDKSLLLKENIAYGFHRNMLALKPIGIFVCMLSIIYALILGQIVLFPILFVWEKLLDPGVISGMTLLISFSFLIAWIFYFSSDCVRRIGFVYAERLFECLNSIPKQKNPVAL